MSMSLQPTHAPHRRSASAAPAATFAALALASSLALLVSSQAWAADPESRVKPRTPGEGRTRPAPDANDAGDPNDRGGTGPNTARKGDKAPESTVVREFAEGAPIWVVRQAFHCALDFDESAGFDCYVPLHVENNRNNENALTHLRRYQWAHFRKWASTYPQPGKGFALRVSRQVPEKLDDTHSEVKIFLVSRHRDNAAPITLRREGGHWRIYASSL